MLYNFVPGSFHTAVMAEALRAKIGRKSAILHQRGHFDPKFLVQGVKNLDRSLFRFVRDHACDGRTDGRTDRRTEFSSLYRVCITCSAVKMLMTTDLRQTFVRKQHLVRSACD